MSHSKPTQSFDYCLQMKYTFRLLADGLCDLPHLDEAPSVRILFIHDSVDQVLVPELVGAVLIHELPIVRSDTALVMVH
jgi:hypothetical protein